MTKQNKQTATICLYGSAGNAAYLAEYAGLQWGTGEPNPDRPCSLNEAASKAADEAKRYGATQAYIYQPTGRWRSLVDLRTMLPYYGDLPWEPAPQLVLACDDIIALGDTVILNDQKGGTMRFRVTAGHVGGASVSHSCEAGTYEDPANILELHITAPSPAAAERAGWDALAAMVSDWPTCRCRQRCRPGSNRWWESVSVQAEAEDPND